MCCCSHEVSTCVDVPIELVAEQQQGHGYEPQQTARPTDVEQAASSKATDKSSDRPADRSSSKVACRSSSKITDINKYGGASGRSSGWQEVH